MLDLLKKQSSRLSRTITALTFTEDQDAGKFFNHLYDLKDLRRELYSADDYRTYIGLLKEEDNLVKKASLYVDAYWRTSQPDRHHQLDIQLWIRFLTAASATNQRAVEVLDVAQKLSIPGAQEGWDLYKSFSKGGIRPHDSPGLESFFKLDGLGPRRS